MWNRQFELKHRDVLLYFGPNVVRDKIGSILQSVKRALIVTSKSAAYVSGALHDVVKELSLRNIEYKIYNNVTSNPSSSIVDEVVEMARSFDPDILVAIGGGSVIDVAKVVSIVYRAGITALEYMNNPRLNQEERLKLVVINLTHGTGSEVNQYAVLTKKNTIEKIGFPARYADISFDDPIYTLTLDREQSFYTSIDAFYHAYESATSRRSNLYVIDLADKAVSHIVSHLSNVLERPSDLESRTYLMYSSMLAGICIDTTKGTHLVHAVEHGVSGFDPRIPHGAGLAMIGPIVVEYTHKAVPEISALILRHIDPYIKPIKEDASKAKKAVEKLNQLAGFDKRLSDFGIGQGDLDVIARFVESTIRARYGYNTPFEVSYDLIYSILHSIL